MHHLVFTKDLEQHVSNKEVVSEIISCLLKYPLSLSPKLQCVLLKREVPTFAYCLNGQWEIIESHQVGLLGNLFKVGLTHWETLPLTIFSFLFSSWLEYRYGGWRSSSCRGQWGSFDDRSLWLRKVECKDRRQPGYYWLWSLYISLGLPILGLLWERKIQ